MSAALGSTRSSLPLAELSGQLRMLALEEQGMPLLQAGRDMDRAPNPERCRLAVYAWVDEVMLTAPRPDAAVWTAHSLQHAFFQTSEAGVLFFQQLDTLLDTCHLVQMGTLDTVSDTTNADDIEATLPPRLEAAARLSRDALAERRELDVYALCLLLGFSGRYYGRPRLLGKLRQAARTMLEGSEGFSPASQKPDWQDRTVYFPPTLEWLFYALLPLAGTVLFGLYCASLLADVAPPGF
jgi:type VI protein secretion system component VasF